MKTPKLHLGDTGLACALLGVDAAALSADRILLGQLLETFVFQELRRQAAGTTRRSRSFITATETARRSSAARAQWRGSK